MSTEDSGADFSEDRKYRFSLWRIWDRSKPLVMFIGLNPSTANETDNDNTIKSVCRIAKHNGFGGVYMMNCFSVVSMNPDVLKGFYFSPNSYVQTQYVINKQKLFEIAAKCKAVIFAWGNFKVVKELNCDKELTQMFPNALCLAQNKNGSPKHPLYCKSETKFSKWNH